MSVLPSPFEVVLTGAGISAGAQLPDGQQLARLAFAALAKGVTLPPSCRRAITSALTWYPSREPALRLELLLELLSREVPLRVLAGVYSTVQTGRPTRTHAAIAASGLRSVTANQDELLEAAALVSGTTARDPVLHLHGKASAPETIMTTIGQYSAGLPRPVQERFSQVVTGGHVLVAGYSGRDLDIMPTLYDAGHITWLHWHRPGTTPGPLSAEAQRLQAELGAKFTLVPTTDVTSWLVKLVPRSERRWVTSIPVTLRAGAPRLSADARAEFDRCGEMERHVAVSRVLLHVNRPGDALAILRPWAEGRGARARALLRAAEAQQMLGNRKDALRLYRTAVRRAEDSRVEASAWLGVAHVHANDGRYADALSDLDRMDTAASAVTNLRHRVDAYTKSAAARGRIQTSVGDDRAAASSYRRAVNLATRNGDFGQRLNALVMGADVYRSTGKPLQAIARLNEAFSDNTIYTRPYSRMWGLFYRGLARSASGNLHGGRADLLECLDRARATGNLQAAAWAQVTLSSFYLHDDLGAAQRQADDCEATIWRYGRMSLCRIRLEWQRAELHRAHGDRPAARDQLRVVSRLLTSDPDSYGAPYMRPHVQAMEAELARAEAHPETLALIDRAMRGFASGAWMQQVAHMRVVRWVYAGRTSPPKRLEELCARNGYELESAVLTGNASPNYVPLHPI